MCDTMVALGNSTSNGQVIFAKNSDRQPNEHHLMIRIPRQRYPEGATVKCTYITIDQAQETYDVLLLKPAWMWGAEMGANEFGLTIGNEAVFTKVKQGPPSLLGMDLVRLALERCQTSDQALHLITDLLGKYGQGGNCGYEKKFVYHNSFLIADRNSAWVLETAGPYWAAEKVKDVRTISNRLSIGRDFDVAHPELISHAISQKWCRSAEDFHFADCYSNPLYTMASGSKNRGGSCSLQLHKAKGQITVETMMEILRSHDPQFEQSPFATHSLKSVCMHGGGIIGDHTTGSYIASLSENLDTYWLTGSSTPCLSIFKPYWMTENSILFSVTEEQAALNFWLLREQLHRLVLQNKVSILDDYRREAQELEKKTLNQVAVLGRNMIDPTTLNGIMTEAWQQEEKLVKAVIDQSKQNAGKIRGSLRFRRYWEKQSRKLGF